ncbi:hypothetical protein, partial [Salinibacterium sp.]|uniref:hypothetical protein n=1 Tax=Salinibacterium sp. TaxID=1915057 RepID=UPI0037CA94A0
MSRSDAITHQVDAVARELSALIDLLRDDHAFVAGSASALAEAIAAVEGAGRLMDCARVRVLAPLVDNSLLAERLGYASPTAAVAAVARISERSARTRLAVAGAVSEHRALSGALLPAERPAVSEALDAGRLGVDAANLIT